MKKILIPVALFVISLLFLAGCGTSSSVVKLGEAPGGYTTLDHEGITLHLGYLDGRSLQRLYSNRNNPFMNYKSGRLIVIEAAIQSRTPVLLNIENARLSTSGGERGATPKQEVYDYWYSILIRNYSSHGGGRNRTSIYHNWSLRVTTEIIEGTIFPPEVEVQAGIEAAGYVLFEQIRGERSADATFTLPVYTIQGELLHEFEYSFPI